jgi:D-threo-aldose 1-dehydrogenase
VNRRALGSTALQVTPLAVGCAEIGNMPETFEYGVPEDRALETLRAAFSSPINFLDTAASYGNGESERRIGLVLREMGGLPPGCVLSTKADRDLTSGDFSGAQIQRSVERSLRLLGLDRLQLVLLHDPEHSTFEAAMASGGPVDVLTRFKEQGVIEHVGVAGGPIDLMMRFVETGRFEVMITHNRFTLLNRSAEPLLEFAAERGVAVLNAAPYGSGMLAKGPQAYPRYAYLPAADDMVHTAQAMADLCQEYGVPLAAAALQFSLRQELIVSTIVGMSRPERVAQTMALAAQPIPDELWRRLEQFSVSALDPEAARWRNA